MAATKKWTMRDGTKIRICDMGDRHLLNTIRMLRRKHEDAVLEAMAIESMVGGEMASYYAAQDTERLLDRESDHPLYDDLEDEAVRRGIRIDE